MHSMLSEFGALHEDVIAVYIKQVLKGLVYLHNRHIVHGDIKGANILITTTGVVKLADFGCSKVLDQLGTPSAGARRDHDRMEGTVPFMAPEGTSSVPFCPCRRLPWAKPHSCC